MQDFDYDEYKLWAKVYANKVLDHDNFSYENKLNEELIIKRKFPAILGLFGTLYLAIQYFLSNQSPPD